MIGTGGRVAVLEVIVLWEEIDIMHHDVVTAISTQQEPSIEQTGSIEPVPNTTHTQSSLTNVSSSYAWNCAGAHL